MVQQMNIASAEYPDGVDEFVKGGFTGLPALRVRPDLVAEAPFQMECRLHQVLELGAGPGAGLMLVGEVLVFHAREDCFDGASLDPDRLDLVGRNGGAWYTRASGAALFQLPKPTGHPVGLDALPEPLKASTILTGNDLGRLAHSAGVPNLDTVERRAGDPEDVPGLERAIQRALLGEDLDEAWRLVGLRLRVVGDGRNNGAKN
jgi:hypothetical protein